MKNRGARVLMVCVVLVFLFFTAPATHAQTFNSLAALSGTAGGWPNAGLVQGSGGNFYGTTSNGGTHGAGTVFEVTPAGTLSTLYNFCSLNNCADGQEPKAGIILGEDGNFYGTTFVGGSKGAGSVFRITPAGALTTLYSFCSLNNCADGGSPNAALIQGTDGNFYGTTERGGTGTNCGGGCGTIFKISSSGAFTLLHSFDSGDGSVPYAGLVQGTDGNFYGTTYVGGMNNAGTVFRVTAAGTLTTIYDFCSMGNCADGTNPTGGLVQGANGNLYGTSGAGGPNGSSTNAGTVFQITTGGTLITIYNFCSLHDCADGSRPYAGLVVGTNGNLYGTTLGGGTHQRGSIFQVTPSGSFATLYSFCSLSDCVDGWYPYGSLVQAANGNFYGTTYWGGSCTDGASGCGTVFTLSLNVAVAPAFKPSALTFSTQALSTTSKPKTVTIKNMNTGLATLDLSAFAVSPPFAIRANKCGATLAPGKSCHLTITFTPTATGAATGTLNVANNGPSNPETVLLKGTGD